MLVKKWGGSFVGVTCSQTGSCIAGYAAWWCGGWGVDFGVAECGFGDIGFDSRGGDTSSLSSPTSEDILSFGTDYFTPFGGVVLFWNVGKGFCTGCADQD